MSNEEKPKIEFARQNDVITYSQEIDRILYGLGHDDAWVSDLSEVGDFGTEAMAQLEEALGFSVPENTTLVALAKQLRERDILHP